MVQYTCERCKSIFNKKSRYDDHLSRKIPCPIKENNMKNENDFYCKICDRSFSRKDALGRHEKSQFHKLLANKSKKIKNNGKVFSEAERLNLPILGQGNLIVNKGDHNKNKIIIDNSKNYFFIAPFSQEEIDDLTPDEKFKIFDSNENPIVMIIIKTNLNPSTPQYHNIGYTNMNKAYGYIFNGNTWQKKEISAIMNDLLNSKRKDLLKVYDEIKEYLPEEQNKDVKIKIDDIENTIDPKLEHQVRSKRKLVLNLKNKFCNNKHLIIEAMYKSGKPIMEYDNTKSNKIKLKEGYTMKDVVREMNQKKENTKRMNIKKELAKDLLKQLDNIDKNEIKSLIDTIETTQDINMLNTITRLLNLSFCFNNKINKKIIQQKLQKDLEVEKILFG